MELQVSSRSQGDQVTVAVSGELDLYTAPRLQAEFAAVLGERCPARVVVDMSGVMFCDSTGVNVLLMALKEARDRGSALHLARPRQAVRKVLRLTGLDAVFTVLDGTGAEGGATAPS